MWQAWDLTETPNGAPKVWTWWCSNLLGLKPSKRRWGLGGPTPELESLGKRKVQEVETLAACTLDDLCLLYAFVFF